MEALQAFLESSSDSAKAEFRYLGHRISVTSEEQISVSESNRDGPYVGRCNTCGEETRGVDFEAAQDFFAVHADRHHEVEIYREDHAESTPFGGLSGSEPEDPEGPDG